MEIGGFLVFNGLVNGFLIALIALGLALIFGIMRIINMAHGDLYMLGAVGAVVCAGAGIPFWVALILMPLLLGGLAMPFERYVLRPLEDNPLATMIATLGLSFVLQQLALITFGGQPRRLEEPVSFTVNIFGLAYPGYRLVAAAIGIVLLVAVWSLVYRSRLGLSLRATIERPAIADAMGINTSRIRAAAFGLGTARRTDQQRLPPDGQRDPARRLHRRHRRRHGQPRRCLARRAVDGVGRGRPHGRAHSRGGADPGAPADVRGRARSASRPVREGSLMNTVPVVTESERPSGSSGRGFAARFLHGGGWFRAVVVLGMLVSGVVAPAGMRTIVVVTLIYMLYAMAYSM